MKEEQYKLLVSQIASLIDGERDMIAVMSNVAAAIHQTMGFWWTGFYRVVGDDSIVWLATSWCLARSKAQSLVCTSHTVRAFAALPGNGQRQSSCLMWSSSQAISPVAASRVLKSLCLSLAAMAR